MKVDVGHVSIRRERIDLKRLNKYLKKMCVNLHGKRLIMEH